VVGRIAAGILGGMGEGLFRLCLKITMLPSMGMACSTTA
jgi:hypothetical protein